MPGRRLLAVLCLALLLATPACGAGGLADLLPDGGGNGGGGGGGTNPDGLTMSEAELAFAAEAARLINLERTGRGLAPLAWDDAVAQVAFEHSLDMQDRGYFDHVTPDGDDPGDRLATAGIPTMGWAENIARGQATPASAVSSWMNSTGHRNNILAPGLTHAGLGVRLGLGGPWWTHLFIAR